MRPGVKLVKVDSSLLGRFSGGGAAWMLDPGIVMLTACIQPSPKAPVFPALENPVRVGGQILLRGSLLSQRSSPSTRLM